MPFTVKEFHDLVRLLEEQPEWRAELRRMVLTEELLALPELVRGLAEAQRRTEERVEKLERRMDQVVQDLGELKGDSLERRYRERAPAYFSPLVRRVHVVFGDELVALLEEAVAQGLLLEEEADEVAQADVVVGGRRREDGAQVYLVVEVSWGVGVSDVERAGRWASFLAKTGTPTLPVVAGRWISQEAADLCREMKVWQLVDGWAVSPDGP